MAFSEMLPSGAPSRAGSRRAQAGGRAPRGDEPIKEIIVENIITGLPVGLVVISGKGEMTIANPVAGRLLGYPVQEMLGKGWGELFFQNPANDDFNQVMLDAVGQARVHLRRTVYYVRPDGMTLRLLLTTSYVSEDGNVEGVVVLLEDLTELHALYEREKTILEDKNRIQAERVESLRYLALAVAHQIRNPVMSIGGFAQRLKKKASEDTTEARYLQFILEGAARLEKIVESVKAYADSFEPRLQTVRLDEAIRAAVEAFRLEQRGSLERVKWEMELDPVEVRLDPSLFRGGLRELLLNSLQALKGGEGTIGLSLSGAGAAGGWRLEVADSGVGIPESDLPYVLDPFFSTRPDAVGMGLAKVYRVVTDHGGTLELESHEGKGTRVIITMPGGGPAQGSVRERGPAK